ncbi:hypothetical protein [Paucilactobacillus sp. N302-9]
MENILELHDVTKKFGHQLVLDHVIYVSFYFRLDDVCVLAVRNDAIK